MANVEKSVKKVKTGNIREKHGSYPTKRNLNLASAGEKHVNPALAVPLIILIVLAAGVFSKFMVADRISAASAAAGRVNELQQQVDDTYTQIKEMSSTVTDEYAHYSYSGMTEEELSRTDRAEVVELIDRYVMPYASVSSWSLSENTLTMPITGTSLEEINEIVDKLNTADLVDFCTFTTAGTGDDSLQQEKSGVTTAELVIYLRAEEVESDVADEAADDTADGTAADIAEEGGTAE